MTREEIIEILIEDKINDWVHAKNHDELEIILTIGWKGYKNSTNQELDEAIEMLVEHNFDKETAKKIINEKKRIVLNRVKKLIFDLRLLIENVYPELQKESTLIQDAIKDRNFDF